MEPAGQVFATRVRWVHPNLSWEWSFCSNLHGCNTDHGKAGFPPGFSVSSDHPLRGILLGTMGCLDRPHYVGVGSSSGGFAGTRI